MGKQKVSIKDIPSLHERRRLSKKKFTEHDLNTFHPTLKQQTFFNLYYQDIPIIVQHGCAGTGKTRTALHAALTEVLRKDTPYDRVILIRSAVETRSQGFLPGDLEEKEAIYELPFRQLVDDMFKWNKSYDNLKELGYIEFCTTSHIRGISIDNAVIILDESQNTDYSELRDVITRVGVNSRLIICGDIKQNDLMRKREKSGLLEFMETLEKMKEGMVGFIHYGVNDICRSDIVKEFLKVEYEKS